MSVSALFLIGALFAAAPTPVGVTPDTDHGVYVLLAADLEGSVEHATTRLTESLEALGWEILATHVTGSPEACPFEARVVVVHSPGYASTIEPYGLQAAFGVPLRLVVFEDEDGVHVGAVNLRSLNRTIVDENVPGSAWSPWQERLRTAVQAAFPGVVLERDYGQVRDQGRIDKTFGVMAGGPFVEKIKTVASVPAAGTSASEVGRRLQAGFASVPGEWEWGLAPVYFVELPEIDAAVLGVSGAQMEAAAFKIVGKGADASRKNMQCPGLDHAPAFPVELVVVQVGDRIEVQAVDAMFRMKMYFEDAGTVAFARNMGMPGSIADEIEAKVGAVLR